MQSAGERRYEVRIGGGSDDKGGELGAIIDTRSPGLLLIRHRPPRSTGYSFGGRDDKGEWSIRSDGSINRDNPKRDWPPFVTDGGESLVIDSIDRLLSTLPGKFTLELTAAAPIEGVSTRLFDRVTAKRNSRSGPEPNTVELWIDPTTKLVERIEYRWDQAAQGGGSGERGDTGVPGPRDSGPRRASRSRRRPAPS